MAISIEAAFADVAKNMMARSIALTEIVFPTPAQKGFRKLLNTRLFGLAVTPNKWIAAL